MARLMVRKSTGVVHAVVELEHDRERRPDGSVGAKARLRCSYWASPRAYPKNEAEVVDVMARQAAAEGHRLCGHCAKRLRGDRDYLQAQLESFGEA